MRVEGGNTFKVPDWFVINGEVASITDSGLTHYLTHTAALETETTVGNESNQLPKNPSPKISRERSPIRNRRKSVLVRADKMSIPDLLAEASR